MGFNADPDLDPEMWFIADLNPGSDTENLRKIRRAVSNMKFLYIKEWYLLSFSPKLKECPAIQMRGRKKAQLIAVGMTMRT